MDFVAKICYKNDLRRLQNCLVLEKLKIFKALNRSSIEDHSSITYRPDLASVLFNIGSVCEKMMN